jgi:PAS domain S-box-containing protein
MTGASEAGSENLELQNQRAISEAEMFRMHAEQLRILNTSRAIIDGDLTGAFREIVMAASNGLGADRATLWIYDLDYTRVRSVAEQRGNITDSSEKVLDRDVFRNYFEALDRERVCAVPDTTRNDAGLELGQGLPPEPKIAAFMAASFAVCGHKTGILRVDQLDRPRAWLPPEVAFLASLADTAALAIEISERHRAERALRANEEKLRMVLETAREFAFLLLDTGGVILECSPGGEHILGYKEWELVGQNGSVLFTPEDRAAGTPEVEMQAALEHGRFADERWHVRKDGARFWASGYMYPLRDEAGAQRGFLKVLRDITERKVAEDRITSLNDALEQKVAERTSELKRAAEQLEAFSYTVAHDLRAPLRTMNSFSQILLEDYSHALPPEAANMLERVKTSSERMDRLIRDLLEFSRLGRMDISLQEVPLANVVDVVLGDLAEDIRANNADVFVRHPMPIVLGNHATLVHVLANLISNALKFTQPGVRPEIKICAEDREPLIRVFVQDNGIGIAEEHRERIFGMFERLHRGDAYAGTGVGLAIVRKAIERLGGHSGVESQLGQGSLFWFELRGRFE